MRLSIQVLVLSFFLIQPAHAAIENEIASINKSMVRTCEVAEIDAARLKQNAVDAFLRYLALLEMQYQKLGDQEAQLACRKARAKYDADAEQVSQPTKTPDQLREFESRLEAELAKLERMKQDKITDAQNRRQRNLTALHKGLASRGDVEGAKLVAEALKSPPALPKPADPVASKPGSSPEPKRTIVPDDVTYLTYVRASKRWQKLEGGRVTTSVTDGITTVHYAEGDHALLKVLWPNVLEVGDHFSVEIQGAQSIELVDVEGADANARSSLPTQEEFVTVEFIRQKDSVTFICNGQQQRAYYASGKLRGEEAQAAILSTPLRAAFSLRKDQQASFRNAKIIRP